VESSPEEEATLLVGVSVIPSRRIIHITLKKGVRENPAR